MVEIIAFLDSAETETAANGIVTGGAELGFPAANQTPLLHAGRQRRPEPTGLSEDLDTVAAASYARGQGHRMRRIFPVVVGIATVLAMQVAPLAASSSTVPTVKPTVACLKTRPRVIQLDWRIGPQRNATIPQKPRWRRNPKGHGVPNYPVAAIARATRGYVVVALKDGVEAQIGFMGTAVGAEESARQMARFVGPSAIVKARGSVFELWHKGNAAADLGAVESCIR